MTKILLAAGVFYPDVGGPAIHVRKIAERLSKEGYDVQVLAYGDDSENLDMGFKVKRISRKHHKIIQWILYVFYTFKFTIQSKLVYAFDPTAAGVPACLASWIFRKPFLIRIGGDPIWEREVELGRRFMSLDKYYEDGLYKNDKPLLYKIIKLILSRSDMVLVVYNQNFKDFYSKYFGVPVEKIRIVKNPISRREFGNPELGSEPKFIFAGRFVSYKNLILVINAFKNLKHKLNKGKLLLIGKGPDEDKLRDLVHSLGLEQAVTFLASLPQEKLFEKVKASNVALGPALSEFNPNFILESLSFGKPVILSKNHGLSVDLPPEFVFDPMDQKDLEEKMEYFASPENYKNAVEKVNKIEMSQSWEKVTDFHLNLVKEIAK